MRLTRAGLLLVTLLCGWYPILGLSDEAITECDRLTAHPSDPDHVGEGVPSSAVVTHLAIPACRAAVAAEPDNPRLHYQLGRALVYWADGNGADAGEGIEHVGHAAEMGYTQALFVMGLMHKRQGDVCAAAPVTHQAALQGLKSARLTYVDDVLAGAYRECKWSPDAAEMAGFLDSAASQVSGYYEGMLLGALRRQLAEWEP